MVSYGTDGHPPSLLLPCGTNHHSSKIKIISLQKKKKLAFSILLPDGGWGIKKVKYEEYIFFFSLLPSRPKPLDMHILVYCFAVDKKKDNENNIQQCLQMLLFFVVNRRSLFRMHLYRSFYKTTQFVQCAGVFMPRWNFFLLTNACLFHFFFFFLPYCENFIPFRRMVSRSGRCPFFLWSRGFAREKDNGIYFYRMLQNKNHTSFYSFLLYLFIFLFL